MRPLSPKRGTYGSALAARYRSLGEIGRYYVVLTSDAQLTEIDLENFCVDKIAEYKVPKEIIIGSSLPLTPSGKVHKATLRNESAQPGTAG